MNFKVNSFIRDIRDRNIKSKIIETVKHKDGNYLTLSNKEVIDEQFFESWKPEDGEYCWMWDNKNNLQLREFKELETNGLYKPYGSVMGFKNCEPLIGELPTLILIKNKG